MTDRPHSKQPTEPRRTAAISSGEFVSGSVFQLVREIRGSAYSVGDQFMLIEGEDCHDPNVLILGGVGENYFIDPHGKPLKIEAGDTQIDSIFELVDTTPQEILEEIDEVDAPVRVVTEDQFKIFREGLATVLQELATSQRNGERGDRGPRGFTGVQGDRGDVGPQGPQGERGETGERGEKGEQGEKGDTGERGPQGERGEPGSQGDRGEKGERGETGETGAQGVQGERGQRGEAGERGAIGSQGSRGERGVTGAAGANGRVGAAGPRGERGEAGARGADGKRGKAGAKGAKGAKGDKGDTGESGIVTAEFPLVYDADKKHIKIDEERLDRILKKILSGKTVSQTDMGWLASTGGGGKVAVYYNGTKITPDVRGIDFTGPGVASVTKVGGKVTVNIQGGGGNTNFFYQQTPPVSGVTVGSRWMDSDNGQEYIYINDGNTEQWVQPSVSSMVSATVNTVVGITDAAYSSTELDYYIGISFAGAVTVTLPESPAAGREVVVKDESGHAGDGINRAITIVGADGEKIDNQNSAVLNISNGALHFIYRSGWRII